MATLVRTWLGLAALGAGLIHLAVAAGAPPALLPPLPPPRAGGGGGGAAPAAARGAPARARWGAPLPRPALGAAMLPPLAWVGLLLAGAGGAHGAEHVAGAH